MTTSAGLRGFRDLCSPCYWGECEEKSFACVSKHCICRCSPRPVVSNSTNLLVRQALARELRAIAAEDSGLAQVGMFRAAQLIEDGEI